MFNFIRRHKLLSLLLFLNVVAVLVAVLVIVIHNSKTATVDILVAPMDSVIELNGAKYENMQSHNIAPGDYHVKISMEGMQTKEFEISVENDGFVRIWTYLLDAEGGFEYYMNHPDDAMILEDAADNEAGKAFVTRYNKIVSIANVLPLEYYDRENPADPIGIFIEQDKEICKENVDCLSVYGGERHQEIAFELIREAGYSPDDYEIIFVPEDEDVTE